MKDRLYIPWIDWLKIVGIYFVTIGHGHLVSDEMKVMIYSFHMPLFFIISGLLYKKRSFVDTVRKTTKTIIIPYFLISFLCLAYYLALKTVQTGFEWVDVWNRLGAICMGLGYEKYNWIPVSSPMWFVVALWLVYLLMSLSRSIVYEYVLLALSIVATVCLHYFQIDTLVPIDSALMAFPFFLIGYKCKDVLLNANNKKLLLVSMLCIPLWFWMAKTNGRVDMCGCRFGESYVLFYLTGLVGSLILITILKAVQLGGGGKKYASGTFLVMGFNVIAVNIVELIWNYLFPTIHINTVIGIVLGLLIILAFYPIIILCRKFFPIIIGNR